MILHLQYYKKIYFGYFRNKICLFLFYTYIHLRYISYLLTKFTEELNFADSLAVLVRAQGQVGASEIQKYIMRNISLNF